MNKKGISPIIAWILILGFTITLGVIVTNWYLGQAKEMTETTLTTLEGGIECNEVNINVAYTKDTQIPPACTIKIANTGTFKIDSVRINEKQYGYNQNPKGYKNFTNTDITDLCSIEKITVMPILKRDKNLAVCPNDRVYEQKQI